MHPPTEHGSLASLRARARAPLATRAESSAEPPAVGHRAAEADALPAVEGYRLLRRIPGGGMGVVYEAEERQAPGRKVAIKFCKLSGSPFDIADSHLLRFEREIQFLARLNHPNIGRVYCAGEAGGIPYFVMEFVPGCTLAEYLRARRLDPSQIVALVCEVCAAVQHAHQNGMIHRDLKPTNILITPEGRPKVVDFGLAKALEPAAGEPGELSITGERLGTPRYMAPEQVACGHVDTRTDLYALGVILYEALCGQHPHPTEGPQEEFLERVRQAEPRRPRALRADLDGELEGLLLKLLQRDPELRYQSAAELADDLERWLRHEPLASAEIPARYFIRQWFDRHRAAAILAAAALALAVNAFALYIAVIRRERGHALTLLENMRGTAENLWQRSAAAAQGGRIDDAMETLALAVALDPENPSQLLRAGRLAQSVRRFEDAAGYYRRVLHLHDDADARRGLAQCLERLEEAASGCPPELPLTAPQVRNEADRHPSAHASPPAKLE